MLESLSSSYSILLISHMSVPLKFSPMPLKFKSSEVNLYQTKEYNTEVLAISVDTPQSLARYKQDNQFNFTLLSDFNKDTIKAYDAVYEQFGHNMKGVGKRAAFVIDGEGIVRYAEVLENAGNIPDVDAIQNAIRNFQTA